MNPAVTPERMKRRIFAALLMVGLAAAGCLAGNLPAAPSPAPSQVTEARATASASPSPTPSATPSLFPDPDLPAWQHYPAPREAPLRPVPLPLTGLNRPEGIRSLLLLGTADRAPFAGTTQAIVLILYDRSTRRASVFSLPPDLFVYLPGFTMQRLQTAYALGGGELAALTLEYNFGIRPDRWMVVNADQFAFLVDDLAGIDVEVPQTDLKLCGGVRAGRMHMQGDRALCYVQYRDGLNEPGRSARQQAVMRALLERFTGGGYLSRLAELYDRFAPNTTQDFTLAELEKEIPLLLALAAPGTINFQYLSQNEMEIWKLPGAPDRYVFVPRQGALAQWMQAGLAFLAEPAPQSSLLQTLVYELTITPTPTATFTSTATATRTRTSRPTITRTRTPTLSRTPTRTRTQTRTQTGTATASATQTGTATDTVTPSPSPSPTETATETPTETATETPTGTPTEPTGAGS